MIGLACCDGGSSSCDSLVVEIGFSKFLEIYAEKSGSILLKGGFNKIKIIFHEFLPFFLAREAA
jgi:hypothetical protein